MVSDNGKYHKEVIVMSGTMHLDGLYTGQANFKRRTCVKYTQASGLPDWSGNIVGEITGSSSSPFYTS